MLDGSPSLSRLLVDADVVKLIGSICMSPGSGMWFAGFMYGAEHFHFNSSGPIVVYYGI
jgi:hypothetical protein